MHVFAMIFKLVDIIYFQRWIFRVIILQRMRRAQKVFAKTGTTLLMCCKYKCFTRQTFF